MIAITAAIFGLAAAIMAKVAGKQISADTKLPLGSLLGLSAWIIAMSGLAI